MFSVVQQLSKTFFSSCYCYCKSTEQNPTELDIVWYNFINSFFFSQQQKKLWKGKFNQASPWGTEVCICEGAAEDRNTVPEFCSDGIHLFCVLWVSFIFPGVVKAGKFQARRTCDQSRAEDQRLNQKSFLQIFLQVFLKLDLLHFWMWASDWCHCIAFHCIFQIKMFLIKQWATAVILDVTEESCSLFPTKIPIF